MRLGVLGRVCLNLKLFISCALGACVSTKDPRDLEIARDFLVELSVRLDLEPALIEQMMPHLLGMTKRVAHQVVRPAAPLAAFVVGYVAAQGGLPGVDRQDTGEPGERVLAALERVDALIEEFKEGHGQA